MDLVGSEEITNIRLQVYNGKFYCCIAEKDDNTSFFHFIIQHVRMDWILRIEDWWVVHTGAESSVYPFFFHLVSTQNLSGYITSQTLTQILVVIPLSGCPPIQCTWSRFLLVMHPRNLRGISTDNTCVLFTLGTRCIFWYFRSTWFRLPSKDVKEVFKSISTLFSKCFSVYFVNNSPSF